MDAPVLSTSVASLRASCTGGGAADTRGNLPATNGRDMMTRADMIVGLPIKVEISGSVKN